MWRKVTGDCGLPTPVYSAPLMRTFSKAKGGGFAFQSPAAFPWARTLDNLILKRFRISNPAASIIGAGSQLLFTFLCYGYNYCLNTVQCLCHRYALFVSLSVRA